MIYRFSLPVCCAVVLAVCCAGSLSAATATTKVLVLGGSQPLSNDEAAFPGNAVAAELQSIMSGDASITGGADVQSRNTYRAITDASHFAGKTLMSWYYWPEELTNTQALLRQGWDYVVMIEDPYVASRFPEYYLEGARAIAAEARATGAQPILVMPWSSGKTALASFGEMSYRVGDGIGAWVAPAGYAWSNLDSSLKDEGVRPTPRGAYLTAATLFSRIYNRSANASSYIPKGMTEAIRNSIANSVLTTVQAEATNSHYSGSFTGPTHVVSPANHKRQLKYTDFNSSTEGGIRGRLLQIFNEMMTSVLETRPPYQELIEEGFPYDFCQSRFYYNSDPTKWTNFGTFDYQDDDSATEATNTMVAGMDRVIFSRAYPEQETDASDVTSEVINKGAFFVPVRVAWARLKTAQPSIPLQRDGHHMSAQANECVAAMMYTLLTGRCCVEPEPVKKGTSDWNYWFCRKTGYEIAWQYATLQERVPGFKVLPSAITKMGIDINNPETLSVRFMYPPTQNVTVHMSIDNSSLATLDKTSLTFTPANYSVAQSVKLSAVKGAPISNVKVTFTTASTDKIFNGLSDDWTYAVAPSVSWTLASQPSVNESGSLTVTAQLSIASTQVVTVPFTVTGTATPGADYDISSNSITIPAGETSGNATIITIAADVLDEDNETIILTMGTPTNAATGAIPVHTASIVDDDQTPTVNWTLSNQPSIRESGKFLVVAQLSAISGRDVMVPFVVEGTATTGADYTITATPITIPAGKISAAATIRIIDDMVIESSETVILTMSAPENAEMGTTTVHTATITDDDGIGLPVVNWTVASQSSANESGTLTVTAQLSAAASSTVTVPFTVTGTATGSDYTITASPITIVAGQVTGTATITITADTIDESNETVILTMGEPTNARLGVTKVHTAIITDDDAPPTVAWTVASQPSENESGTLTVTARLSAASGQSVSVPFTVTGTASAGDYTINSSPITIAAGNMTGTATITIMADTIDEPDETVILTMGEPTNATLGSIKVHTATVIDDDAMPSVAFSPESSSGGEPTTTVTLAVGMSAVSSQTVTVDYAVTGGTATGGGVDFTLASGKLTFLAGKTTQEIALTIVNDALSEANETIFVTLSQPVNATLGANAVRKYTITDDDSDLPTVVWTEKGKPSVNESGTLTVTAQLSAASSSTVTVPFTVTGTATSSDYTITASPITIAAGQVTGTATITITADTIDEPNETVILTMDEPTNATLGATTVHTATITDDDNDTTPPVTPSAPTTNSNSSTTPTLTGKTEAGATIQIYDNGILIGTKVADEIGNWSWEVSPPLGSGVHQITVTATDVAGNTSPHSSATTITISGSNEPPTSSSDAGGKCGVGSGVTAFLLMALTMMARFRGRRDRNQCSI